MDNKKLETFRIKHSNGEVIGFANPHYKNKQLIYKEVYKLTADSSKWLKMFYGVFNENDKTMDIYLEGPDKKHLGINLTEKVCGKLVDYRSSLSEIGKEIYLDLKNSKKNILLYEFSGSYIPVCLELSEYPEIENSFYQLLETILKNEFKNEDKNVVSQLIEAIEKIGIDKFKIGFDENEKAYITNIQTIKSQLIENNLK